MEIFEALEVAETAVSEAIADHDAAVKAAEKEVRQFESEADRIANQRKKAVKEAEKTLRKAENERESAIRKLEKEIKSVERSAVRRIDSYGDIVLYADRVIGSGVEVYLNEEVEAEVAVNGNTYSYTGLLGGLSHNWYASDTKDKRTLSLTVNSPKGMLTTMGKPDEEKKAREFAALVRNIAVNAQNASKERDRKIKKLKSELNSMESDTRSIDEARALLAAAMNDPSSEEAATRAKAAIEDAKAALAATQNDTSAIETAQKSLAEIKAQMSTHDLAAYEEARTKHGRKNVIIVAGVVVAIVLLVILFVLAGQ